MTKVFNNNPECFLKIGREVNAKDVNIAFYKTPELNPGDNITILNQVMTMSRSLSEINETRCFVDDNYILFRVDNENKHFYSRGFNITDKLVDSNNDGESDKPVYFRYKLRYVHLDTTEDEVKKNIKIIKDDEEVNKDKYFYHIEVNKLEGQINNYNRFEVEIYTDFIPQKNETFYISYNQEKKGLIDYNEILNLEEIFTRVSNTLYYDEYINTDEKVYTIERLEDGFYIKVPIKAYYSYYNSSTSNKLYNLYNANYNSPTDFNYDTREYYLKFNNSSNKIYAKINESLTDEDEWPLEIHYDSFVSNTGDKKYVYSIPEFFYQDLFWSNGKPYMSTKNELANVLDEHSIKTKYSPLKIDLTNTLDEFKIPENILVKDEDGVTYTVINWDNHNGILKVLERLPEKRIYLDYDYYAEFHKYNGYYDENNNFIHLDLNPAAGHFYSKKMLGQEIVDSKPHPTYELSNKTIYIYLKPEYIVEDGEITRNQFTLFHTIGHDLHKDAYHPLIEDSKYKYTMNDIKLIAKVFITPITNPEEMKVIDTRTRGGGIKDGFVNMMKELYEEVNYYWDIGNWNGKYYPSNGVVVIELPKEILNKFSHDEVKAKIEKHLALGVLPVIKYQ